MPPVSYGGARNARASCYPTGNRVSTDDRPDPLRPAVSIKRYGRVTALDNAHFDLMPGEILAVIGDNGAGKSKPDQGDLGGGHPRRRRDQARRQTGQFQLADGGAEGGDRDRLSEPGSVAGSLHRRQSLPRPRDPKTRTAREKCSACSTGPRCGARPASIAERSSGCSPSRTSASRSRRSLAASGRAWRSCGRRPSAAASSSWTSRPRRSASRNREKCSS